MSRRGCLGGPWFGWVCELGLTRMHGLASVSAAALRCQDARPSCRPSSSAIRYRIAVHGEDAGSAPKSDHQSDGLAGRTSSKNAVIIGSRTSTTPEIAM